MKRKEGKLLLTKVSDGIAVASGTISESMKEKLGPKASASLQKAIDSGSRMNANAMRAVLADAQDKDVASQMLDFGRKQAGSKGLSMRVRVKNPLRGQPADSFKKGQKMGVKAYNPANRNKDALKSQEEKDKEFMDKYGDIVANPELNFWKAMGLDLGSVWKEITTWVGGSKDKKDTLDKSSSKLRSDADIRAEVARRIDNLERERIVKYGEKKRAEEKELSSGDSLGKSGSKMAMSDRMKSRVAREKEERKKREDDAVARYKQVQDEFGGKSLEEMEQAEKQASEAYGSLRSSMDRVMRYNSGNAYDQERINTLRAKEPEVSDRYFALKRMIEDRVMAQTKQDYENKSDDEVASALQSAQKIGITERTTRESAVISALEKVQEERAASKKTSSIAAQLPDKITIRQIPAGKSSRAKLESVEVPGKKVSESMAITRAAGDRGDAVAITHIPTGLAIARADLSKVSLPVLTEKAKRLSEAMTPILAEVSMGKNGKPQMSAETQGKAKAVMEKFGFLNSRFMQKMHDMHGVDFSSLPLEVLDKMKLDKRDLYSVDDEAEVLKIAKEHAR